MPNAARIRLHYPLAEGELRLRADPDWERDLAPVGEDRAAGTFDFRVRFDAEFLYFKPVLRDGRGLHWAQGENCLALPDGQRATDCYPHFFSDATCSVCNLHEVASRAEGVTHAVRVFYPPGYAENSLERYPALYMQDGQNLFFPSEAFGGRHWKVEETLSVLGAMNLVRKVIVVGIYPNDRTAQYTKPGYEAYGRFLAEELVPWVDARYRTLPSASERAVLGSSLGGVVSFYAGWQHAEVFGNAGCMSSTFAYHDDLLERVAREPKRPLRIYLDTGWPRDNYEVNRRMRHLLVRRGWREGSDLLYLAFPEAKHDESAWAMRAHVPFQWFFGERPAPPRRAAA
jgi:predicted alpha/beta superfamily hydrolase